MVKLICVFLRNVPSIKIYWKEKSKGTFTIEEKKILKVIGRYFNLTKVASFTRQLNFYGFSFNKELCHWENFRLPLWHLNLSLLKREKRQREDTEGGSGEAHVVGAGEVGLGRLL